MPRLLASYRWSFGSATGDLVSSITLFLLSGRRSLKVEQVWYEPTELEDFPVGKCQFQGLCLAFSWILLL